MNNYQQTLDINASPAMVYAALTTPEGLRGWWTQDCDVPAEVGATIHFRFDRTYKDMRIDRPGTGPRSALALHARSYRRRRAEPT